MKPSFLLAAILGLGTPAMVQAQAFACRTDAVKAAKLRAQVVDLALSPSFSDFRNQMGLAAPDTSRIQVVTTDSVCDAVTRAVNATATSPTRSALIVVTLGSLFAACVADSANVSSIFILDDHYALETVIVGS